MKWIEDDRVIFIKNEHKNVKVTIPTFVKFYGPNNSDKKKKTFFPRTFSVKILFCSFFLFFFFFLYRYTRLFVYSKTSKHYFPLTIKSTIAK